MIRGPTTHRVTPARPSPARAWRPWPGGGIAVVGVLALLAIHAATSPTETSSAAPATSSFEGAVSRAVDDDTLWIDGQSVRILPLLGQQLWDVLIRQPWFSQPLEPCQCPDGLVR
jgi:hypothetical protein